MKTVTLIWGYTHKNAGDLAMTLGAIDLLPKCALKLQIFSLFHEKTPEFFYSKKYLLERYPDTKLDILGSPFYINKNEKNSFKKLFDYFNIITILLNIKKIHKFRNKLLDSQVILFNGGNMFRCITLKDAFRMFCVFFPIKIGLKKKIPCFILPQSSASINKIGETFLKTIVYKVNKIYFREHLSFESFSKTFGLKNAMVCMDLAFFINKNNVNISNQSIKRHIAFTIRSRTIGDSMLLSQDKLDYLEKTFYSTIKQLSINNKITIVVQVPIDKEFSIKIKSMFNDNIHFLEETDPVNLLKFYNSIDLLIGMRLHSMILAMSIGTPCYGLFFKEWGNKVPGILEMLNMPYLELNSYPQIDFKEIENLVYSKKQINKTLLDLIERNRRNLANEINNCLKI